MSHIKEATGIPVRSLESLQLAAVRLGGELRMEQKTYRWYGQWVGDTPMPKGMTKADLGRCDHAIHFPGVDYEVGVRANADGTYTLAYDYWHAGGLSRKLGGDDLPLLAQAYATELVKYETRRLGGAVDYEEVLPDGTVHLRLLAAE